MRLTRQLQIRGVQSPDLAAVVWPLLAEGNTAEVVVLFFYAAHLSWQFHSHKPTRCLKCACKICLHKESELRRWAEVQRFTGKFKQRYAACWSLCFACKVLCLHFSQYIQFFKSIERKTDEKMPKKQLSLNFASSLSFCFYNN